MDLIESKELRPIEQWTPFIVQMVNRNFKDYCRCQDDFNDLISVGMTELVHLHNSIARRHVTNKNARLYKGVYYRIYAYVGRQSEIRKNEKKVEYITNIARVSNVRSTNRKLWLLEKLKSQLSPIYLETLEIMRDTDDTHEIARRLGLSLSGATQRVMAIRGKAAQLIKRQTGGGMGWAEMWG